MDIGQLNLHRRIASKFTVNFMIPRLETLSKLPAVLALPVTQSAFAPIEAGSRRSVLLQFASTLFARPGAASVKVRFALHLDRAPGRAGSVAMQTNGGPMSESHPLFSGLRTNLIPHIVRVELVREGPWPIGEPITTPAMV